MRVLVVGTNRACHHRLHRHGHELVLFVPRGKAKSEDVNGPYRHVVMLDGGTDVESWVAVAAELHHRAPFDAVVAYNEDTYRIVDAIGDRLAIPHVVDLALFARVRDKAAMRDILAREGVASCRYASGSGRDSLAKAIEHVGLPCIVKPVDAEGSLGVIKIAEWTEVEPALHRIGAEFPDRTMLVEEYLVGEEVSVEAVSTARRHHIVAVTKKFIDERTFVERGHVVPAPLSDAVRATVERYVTQVLDALGFHDCPSHTELMLTAAGPRIIETHNRIGGDRIMDLVQHATGVDLYDIVARQSLGEDVGPLLPDPVPHHRAAAVWYAAPSVSPGLCLLEVGNADRARELPQVKTLDLLREPGSRQSAVRSSFDRSALAVAVGDTADEAVRAAQTAIGRLRFTYGVACDEVDERG